MRSIMSDRKAELERKKAKLAALREERDKRRREKELKDVEDATNRAMSGGGPGGDLRQLDETLYSLGIAPVSEVLSSISSANSLTPEHSMNHTPDTSLQHNSLPNNVVANKRKAPVLSLMPVQTTSIPPKEVVNYTKQTQTQCTGGSHERDGYVYL